MFLIVGYVIILAAALGTYAIHGSLLALWVPTEYIAIVGLVIGYFVASNNMTLIKATVAAVPGVLKGSKFNKAFYIDALAMLFEILSKVRKEGLMSIMARLTGMESWVWRMAFALLFLFWGAGLLLYILLWIFVPDE